MKYESKKLRGKEDLANYCKELVTRIEGNDKRLGDCQATLLLEIAETAKLNNKLLIGMAKETRNG